MASKHKPVANDLDRLVTRRELMAVLNAYHRVYHRPEPVSVPHSEVVTDQPDEVPVAPV